MSIKSSRGLDHNNRHKLQEQQLVRKNLLKKNQFQEENRKKSTSEMIHSAPDAMMKKMKYLLDR